MVVGTLAVALVFAVPGLGAAGDSDPRLQEAQERRVAVQQRLDEVLQRLAELEADIADREVRLAELEAHEQEQTARASEASDLLAARVRESYIRGSMDETVALLGSRSVTEAREQARLLGFLAVRSRSDMERAGAERVRTEAAAGEVEHAAEALRARQAEMDAVHAEVAGLLAEAQAAEDGVRAQIAAEERARQERERRERERREREERERVAQQRAARSSAQDPPAAPQSASAATASAPAPAPAAPSGGGVACPVGQPRSYSDTWGAARSGGRRHKGTDILAPRGTPIFAYESGTVTRLWSSGLGGISLYLRGNSGNVYYYTHLQGYAGGLSAGQRVAGGQHIAVNGDTGNARGIPHLHFEVMPGGGGNVNPYPYVARACG